MACCKDMEGLVIEELAEYKTTQYTDVFTDDDRPSIAFGDKSKKTLVNFCPFCGSDFRVYYKR